MTRRETIESLRDQIRRIESEGASDLRPEAHNARTLEEGAAFSGCSFESAGFDAQSNQVSEPTDEARQAFDKIVALVNASDKSERKIRERLSGAGFSGGAIEHALSRARDLGFVDDGRFAHLLVQSRISQGKGRIAIERDLLSNGISPESVSGWPHDYPMGEEDELERAIEVLRKNPPRSKNVRDGAFRKLASRGFPSSVASRAARIWCDESRL